MKGLIGMWPNVYTSKKENAWIHDMKRDEQRCIEMNRSKILVIAAYFPKENLIVDGFPLLLSLGLDEPYSWVERHNCDVWVNQVTNDGWKWVDLTLVFLDVDMLDKYPENDGVFSKTSHVRCFLHDLYVNVVSVWCVCVFICVLYLFYMLEFSRCSLFYCLRFAILSLIRRKKSVISILPGLGVHSLLFQEI